jgi:hypothetical protein
MSLPYYREHGWDPVVLTVGGAWQQTVKEPNLLSTVPADARIEHTRALSLRLSRLVGIGNLGIRALPWTLWRGCALLRREKFDLVFFSNTQFITFLLGRLWRFLFRVPYVIDVQDPWRTDYYERRGSRRPPGGWKYGFARLSAWAFEGWSFARAAGVMSVSPAYLAELGARYPGFAEKPQVVIRFGASADDLERARALPPSTLGRPRANSEVHFLYTGASGPVMPHAISVLFAALRSYRALKPGRAARLKFHFIGTSYVASGRGRPSVVPLALEFGVADQIDEIPHRIGFLDSLRLQMDADVLLLPGSSDPAYSPSKVYLYYLAGPPILGLVFKDSVMEQLLKELSCATVVSFQEWEKKDDAQAAIQAFFDLALAGFPPGSLPVRNDSYFNAHYLARELTGEQCRLFERAISWDRAP